MSVFPLRFRLEIAGLGIDVHAAADMDLSAFEDRARRYARAPGKAADDIVEIDTSPAADGNASSVPVRSRPGTDLTTLQVEAFETRLVMPIVSSPSDGPAHSHASVGMEHPHRGFENTLRILMSRRVLEHGGAMLHAAALQNDGIGVAFPGESGAGKSTLTMRQPARMQIAEDLIVVRPGPDGDWIVEALPFLAAHSIDVGPRHARLLAFAFPRKAEGVRLRRLSPEACLRALARSLVVFTPHGLERRALDRLIELSAAIPGYDLELDRTTPFWPDLCEWVRDTSTEGRTQ